MSTYSGVVSGSFHQTLGIKGSSLYLKHHVANRYPDNTRFNNRRSCKAFSIQGSLVTGRPSSSVSVSDAEMGGMIIFILLTDDYKEDGLVFVT